MQIIQWSIWNNALVKTGFLKIETAKEISPLPCHYTSYNQKGSYLFVCFSIKKSVILKLALKCFSCWTLSAFQMENTA